MRERVDTSKVSTLFLISSILNESLSDNNMIAAIVLSIEHIIISFYWLNPSISKQISTPYSSYYPIGFYVMGHHLKN